MRLKKVELIEGANDIYTVKVNGVGMLQIQKDTDGKYWMSPLLLPYEIYQNGKKMDIVPTRTFSQPDIAFNRAKKAIKKYFNHFVDTKPMRRTP